MKLGIVGCGKMGTALLDGALAAKAITPEDVLVGAPKRQSSIDFANKRNLKLAEDSELLQQSDVLLMCVKPHLVCSQLSLYFGSGFYEPKLVISVAAGIQIEKLEEAARGQRVIRVMPNTPSLVGAGAAGFAANKTATEEDVAFAEKVLGSVGVAVQLPESLLDSVTGVSGSGPAYIYMIIEAMADAGVQNGLQRDVALQLAVQTVIGSALMVANTGLHPAQLKDQVTSPGGTTIAAVATLEKNGLRSTLIEAVTAATEKARELGQN